MKWIAITTVRVNSSMPMCWFMDWTARREALDRGIARIRGYGPDLLLVSLGVEEVI